MKHTITVTDVEETDIVGIEWPNGHRSAIIKVEGRWEGTLQTDLSVNPGGAWNEKTIHEYIRRAIKRHEHKPVGVKVMKFWSSTQLINWMKKATNTQI